VVQVDRIRPHDVIDFISWNHNILFLFCIFVFTTGQRVASTTVHVSIIKHSEIFPEIFIHYAPTLTDVREKCSKIETYAPAAWLPGVSVATKPKIHAQRDSFCLTLLPGKGSFPSVQGKPVLVLPPTRIPTDVREASGNRSAPICSHARRPYCARIEAEALGQQHPAIHCRRWQHAHSTAHATVLQPRLNIPWMMKA
jgi:hypothetical protein